MSIINNTTSVQKEYFPLDVYKKEPQTAKNSYYNKSTAEKAIHNTDAIIAAIYSKKQTEKKNVDEASTVKTTPVNLGHQLFASRAKDANKTELSMTTLGNTLTIQEHNEDNQQPVLRKDLSIGKEIRTYGHKKLIITLAEKAGSASNHSKASFAIEKMQEQKVIGLPEITSSLSLVGDRLEYDISDADTLNIVVNPTIYSKDNLKFTFELAD